MISKLALRNLKSMYLDQPVILYLRDMNVVTVDENQQELKIAAMIEGWVVDMDQDFIHLGLPDGTILKSIQHELAQLIEIQLPVNEFMTDQFPNSDEDIH